MNTPATTVDMAARDEYVEQLCRDKAKLIQDLAAETKRREEAEAEGVRRMHEDDLGQTWKTYRRGFQSAWDSIYAAKGRGWDANPWVWAVEFKAAAKTLNESRAILEGA